MNDAGGASGDGPLADRYSALFTQAMHQLKAQLGSLPDLNGLDELQTKIIFTAIVVKKLCIFGERDHIGRITIVDLCSLQLAYRSVVESVERRRKEVWQVLTGVGAVPSSTDSKLNEANIEFDNALYKYMHQMAKTSHGIANAKVSVRTTVFTWPLEILVSVTVSSDAFQVEEVTSKIWETLYDFPSLKSSTPFNRFILECVDMSWDIVAGHNGSSPRYMLVFEGDAFDPDIHLRYQNSSLRSFAIKRFIWPALLRAGNNNDTKVLRKAIVAT